jgi:hypothetical protein
LELIEVTARFDEQGVVHPISFSHAGRTYRIAPTGRRWEDERGLHILVMAPLERVVELVFVPSQKCWYLARQGLDRSLA